MANKIVKDSDLPIFVKDVQVAPSTLALTDPTFPKVNDLVIVGAIAGLIGPRPRQGEDGNYYSTVDTAALIRVSGVTGAFTDKQPVYLNASDKSLGTASGTGKTCIGYADRPKTATAAGDLWVQLVPSATGA